MGNDEKQLAREHEERMRKIELKNIELEYRNEERDAMMRKPKKKMSASKIMMAAIILICVEIIFFAEYVIAVKDSSSLYILIGIPASLVASFWAYASKSKAENTEGGVVYEATMAEIRQRQEYDMEEENIESENEPVG